MAVYAIVPVKVLDNSKRRLSQVLNQQQRKLLTMAMLGDVLTAISSSAIKKTVVVSDDVLVESTAAKYGAIYLKEKGHGLNSAIRSATEWCILNGADSTLVLPADIPLVSALDINSMLALGGKEQSVVVVAPSHNGGTNALFLKPPNAIDACFGARSFRKHVNKALSRCVPLKLHYSNSVAMDMDEKSDLEKLLQTPNGTQSKAYLQQVVAVANAVIAKNN